MSEMLCNKQLLFLPNSHFQKFKIQSFLPLLSLFPRKEEPKFSRGTTSTILLSCGFHELNSTWATGSPWLLKNQHIPSLWLYWLLPEWHINQVRAKEVSLVFLWNWVAKCDKTTKWTGKADTQMKQALETEHGDNTWALDQPQLEASACLCTLHELIHSHLM